MLTQMVANKSVHHVADERVVWHCDLDTAYAMLIRNGTKITVPKEYHGHLS